ncbi:hypothetical protein [Nannocystis pusilla]|uniref:hypothetical protein n=1 Tax=Nannocystis pusilla TaxID=889268 RepID=UPI003DA69CE3
MLADPRSGELDRELDVGAAELAADLDLAGEGALVTAMDNQRLAGEQVGQTDGRDVLERRGRPSRSRCP